MILIGIEVPVQTVCKPYLKVFDELGIEPNEVGGIDGKGEKDQMSKPMYRLVDGKGRVLIPKSMREAAKAGVWGYCLSGNGGWKNYSPEGRGYRGGEISLRRQWRHMSVLHFSLCQTASDWI